ncbi:stonustoxin subunit alpha-like isoform X2 [Thunnus thynnus]|uniref:stonustoxin subunit alpha-like isoform X2 n=1 Tax=Thunnus thynnus TaxID=8237 RepID=UPI0035284ACC
MDADATGTMAVAALGRPFSLGMLYDCRNDSLIPGMTLWDLNDLKNDIQERPQCYNNFEIVASESIADKSSALNVEASLKASFLGGLVEVGGSAKYLKDSKTSKNQARVTLNYQATTKMKQLSMNHLGTHNVKHRDVIDKKIATHVVTGILYGAQAFFVFDREVSDEESHHDIQGKMKMMIKKIPKLTIKGEGSLKMKDEEKESVEKFSCKFHGDFLLEKTPTSFQDAIQVYQNLPQLLGTNGENAVPMKVWLMPLVSLDSSAAKLVRQISIRLVQESQSVLEDFTELEMRCNDAMRTTTAQQFPQIGEKLKTFAQFCSEYKLEFQQNLAKKLPLIRGGGEEEAVLAEILKKRHSSPFNNTSLNEWMDCKEREIYTLLSLTNKMNNTRIVSSQSHLNREILSTEHAVCFVFTSLGSAEPYLSDLLNYLKETPKPDKPQYPQTDDVEKEQWYTSKEVSDAMRKKAKLFSDFAEANKENENIKFLTVGLTNETQKGSSIYVYEDGFSVSENFELPSKPETVTAGDVTHNSVTLKICPPRFGAENISSYSVEYCVSREDGWQQKPAPKAEEVTVSDLTPDTEFMFRCRAVTSVGVGPAGEVSGPIKTLPCSPPEKPQVEANPERSSSVDQQSAADVMESSSVSEGTNVSQRYMKPVKPVKPVKPGDLKEALQGLRDLMTEECYKSAERLMNDCINKTSTDVQQSLLDHFTLMKKQLISDKGNKVQQERPQQSEQTAKKPSSSSSSLWSPKVKVYWKVTDQTFGAHQVLLDKVKNMKWTTVTVETTRDLQESHVVIVFCPIMSRVGSDVDAAMTDITGSCGQKPVILVLMHHTRDVDYSTDGTRWSDVYDNVVLDVHVLFHKTKNGLLTCPKNHQAVTQIQRELQKYKEVQEHSKWMWMWS